MNVARSFFSRHYSQYKDSFFDYFDQNDQENVLQILNKYKIIHHEYYKILIKKYGENYNRLNLNIELTENEEKKLNRLRANIRKFLKELHAGKTIDEIYVSNQKIYTSFLDYFEEKDRNYAKQIIHAYSYFQNDYYDVLVKRYGEQYDCLNVDIDLTINEEKKLNSFKTLIKGKINAIHSGTPLYDTFPKNYKLLVGPQGYLDQFSKKYKDIAIDIIEKQKNGEYYQILVKQYGEKYDHFNPNVLLTDEENSKLNYLTSIIKFKIKEVKKKDTKCKIDESDSFYNFFNEEDYPIVTKIMSEYQLLNHKYYRLVIKKYGENYNNVDPEVELTKEEKQQIRTFINMIKEQIKKIKSGEKLEETLPYNHHHYYKSFLDYFDKKQRENVIHIIDQFQITNPDYYELIVKRYGKNYDTINLEVELTNEDRKSVV